MRKNLIIFIVTFYCISCGGNSSSSDNTKAADTTTAAAPAKPDDPMASKGMGLITQSDCLTCHKLTEASTGPAYAAIAAKYKDDPAKIDSLPHKIITGGSGNWGTTPMTSHPDLSVDDAKAMVAYIMTIKN